MIDTVEISHKLQASGIPQNQAEAIAQSMLEIPDWANLATKSDLDVLRADLRAEIVRAKYDLIYWVVGAFIFTNAVQVVTHFLGK